MSEHDKTTCGICEGRDWFPPVFSSLIDSDILEYGTEAHLMQAEVIQLQLARAISKLSQSLDTPHSQEHNPNQ